MSGVHTSPEASQAFQKKVLGQLREPDWEWSTAPDIAKAMNASEEDIWEAIAYLSQAMLLDVAFFRVGRRFVPCFDVSDLGMAELMNDE